MHRSLFRTMLPLYLITGSTDGFGFGFGFFLGGGRGGLCFWFVVFVWFGFVDRGFCFVFERMIST